MTTVLQLIGFVITTLLHLWVQLRVQLWCNSRAHIPLKPPIDEYALKCAFHHLFWIKSFYEGFLRNRHLTHLTIDRLSGFTIRLKKHIKLLLSFIFPKLSLVSSPICHQFWGKS